MLKSVAAIAVALTIVSGAAQAETTPTEKALGELMAVMVMSERCQVQLSAEIVAQIDVEGPRLQKAAGIKDEEMRDVAKEISGSFSDSDCPSIKGNVEKIAVNALSSAKQIP